MIKYYMEVWTYIHVCADMGPFYIYSHESRQNKEYKKHILSFRSSTLATASKKYFLKMITAEKYMSYFGLHFKKLLT